MAKRTKRWIKWLISIIIVVILVVAAVGVALIIREHRRAERAAYYAEQEAAMQAEVFDFTIRPGETLADIRQHLIDEAGYSAKEVDQALAADYDYAFLASRPSGATLEGFLFGETKQFYKSTPATEVIDFYLSEMQKVINDNQLESRFRAQGLSLFEGITLASIVQKEAAALDMPKVAQVFLRRLDLGISLGSDVTVTYALDQIDPNREIYGDNQSALSVDSCYNTRLYRGLPCGPISNPGLAALKAVANPADTTYLYFLTGDDGKMYYSYTDEEHVRNMAEHCQTLCQIAL